MTLTASTQLAEAEVGVSALLLPVDLSHESWSVLPLAEWIAHRLSVPVDPLFVDVSTLGTDAVLEHPLLLRATVAGATVSVEVVPGSDVAVAIEKLAHDRPGSVVVMSTHGLGGFADRAWGSVCDDLLRGHGMSVLAVGPGFDAQRNAEIRRVVVCIDAAAPDNDIVRDALAWAQTLGVPLLVVTVQARGRSRPGEDETYQLVSAIYEDLPPARVSVTAEVLDEMDVGTAIVQLADRRSGTLLAIAPGAEPGATHALTHNVAMQVARESHAPMLLRWHCSGSQPRSAVRATAPAGSTSCHDSYDGQPVATEVEVVAVAGTGCHDDYDFAAG
jgi:nucleotide-binding universal stress UspA family protein